MGAIVSSVMQVVGRWRERHEAVMRLQRLDDRLLRDIGIGDRGDILHRVARAQSAGSGDARYQAAVTAVHIRDGVLASRARACR